VLVVCTGARPVVPPVPGVERPHVVQAVDLLGRPLLAAGARHVVVIGGGEVGCETAYLLAGEQGKQVTVVEMLPYFMQGACTANRGYLIHYLTKKGVTLLNCARLDSVEEREVVVTHNTSPTVPDPSITWSPVLPTNVKNPLARPIKVREERLALPADLVVLAVGLKPDDALHTSCIRAHAAAEIYHIGDAFSPGRILEATRSGYAVGRQV
jgi:2-enoate reductase